VTNTHDPIDWPNWAVIALLGLAVAFAFRFAPAQAHDWYPKECCHDNDCAPVESTARTSTLAASSELPSMGGDDKAWHGSNPAESPAKRVEGQSHACLHESWSDGQNAADLHLHTANPIVASHFEVWPKGRETWSPRSI